MNHGLRHAKPYNGAVSDGWVTSAVDYRLLRFGSIV